jgi:NhaA family Na+:H+ antiporter
VRVSRPRAHHSPAAAAFLDKLDPFFAGTEVTGGPLLLATIVALVCTNIGLADGYERFWDTDLTIAFGARQLTHGLTTWIDDALLPLFFVIIGADVKCKLVQGELSRLRMAIFPLAGAIGGLAMPVLLFLLFNHGGKAARGWGTMVAMDTAFGLGLIALLDTTLPPGVRALMLGFAAIDDIGGLLVIAGAYTENVDWTGLIMAGVALLGIVGFQRLCWVTSIPYVVLALVAWSRVLA